MIKENKKRRFLIGLGFRTCIPANITKKHLMMSGLILFVRYETVSHSNCFCVFTRCCTVPVQTDCNYSKIRLWYIPPLPGFVCWDQSGSSTDGGQTGLSAPPGSNLPADTKTRSLAMAKHPGGTRKEVGDGCFCCING